MPGPADGNKIGIGTDRPRVLIVEDDPRIALALSNFFRIWNWLPTVVETGPEAIAYLESGVPLVVLDLFLPGGMDGVDVLQHIRDVGLTCVVAVATAVDSSAPIAKLALALNPDRIDYKPIDWQAFGDWVETIRKRLIGGSPS